MSNVRQLRTTPDIRLQYFTNSPDLRDQWIGLSGLRAIGRNLISDRYWALEGQHKIDTSLALGRLIVANCYSIEEFRDVGASYVDGITISNRGNADVVFLGLSAPSNANHPDHEALFDTIANATNRDLKAFGSRLELPLQ